MKEFTLPKAKKQKAAKASLAIDDNYDLRWRRRVRFPANKDIIADMSVGDEVSVIVTGKVVEVSSQDSETSTQANFEIDVDKIGLDEKDNAFAELADD